MVREWDVDWELQEEVRGIDIDFQGPPDIGVPNEPVESQASPWITVVSGAGVGLKGAYIEMIEETDRAGTWVLIQIMAGAGFQQNIFIEHDFAIGLMGSEVIFVPDLAYTQTTPGVGSNAQQDFSFPFNIPAGSRISCRSKDDKSNARNSLVLFHSHG